MEGALSYERGTPEVRVYPPLLGRERESGGKAHGRSSSRGVDPPQSVEVVSTFLEQSGPGGRNLPEAWGILEFSSCLVVPPGGLLRT